MNIVQLILAAALVICLGLGITVFIQALAKKEGKRSLFQLAGIELVLFTIILLAFLVFFKSDSPTPLSIYIFMALIYTLLANIPIGLITVVIRALLRNKKS